MKKRHHVIPQLHLRRFIGIDPLGHVWTYDMQRDEVRSSTTEATAFESHLYSVTREDGTRITAMEDVIADIEDKAAPLIDKLMRDGTLVGQERADFASFLAMMKVRTNSFRRQFAEAMVGMQQQIMRTAASHRPAFDSYMRQYEDEHGPMSAEMRESVRKAMLNPSGYKVLVDREATLRAIVVHDELVPILFDMRWSVLTVPAGRFLVTSDNPMSQMVPPQHQRPLTGHGMLDRHVEMTMPLSPEVCWMGHWRKDMPAAAETSVEGSKELNRLRAYFAEGFLFADRRDAGIRQLAHKFRDDKPRMQVGPIGDTKVLPVTLCRPNAMGSMRLPSPKQG